MTRAALSARAVVARLATPPSALALGTLSLAALPAALLLRLSIGHAGTSTSDLANTGAGVAFVLAFTLVGVVVARREPHNPIGWVLIALVLSVAAGTLAPTYARLDYVNHHGSLPLGQLAVLLSPAWEYAFVLMPLVILLFPDGHVGRAWRWPLRVYAVLALAVVAGTISVAVAAFGLRVPVDASGNLVGLNDPHGANAWFGPVQALGLGACFVLVIAAVIYQVRRFRHADGERRQQLKCLATGAGVCVACIALNSATGGGSGLVGDLTFSVGLAALPLSIGLGILKYRLYEIDRLISRTLSYAILTALLVGTFIGLVALCTDTLAISGRIGVAASTLAAAALFNPLRKRIQHLVDRRFNRARYDAEATVAAFSARLRDAVELDTIRVELLDTVNRVVQPTHASVWIKPHARG